jgi:hypothetical protein
VSAEPRVLVVTIVHRPDDARILHRQIATLRAEGFAVTYAAPWSVMGVEPPEGLAVRELPRATGRDRLAAMLAAKDLLRREAAHHDLVVIHDPDLLLSVRLAGVRRLPPVVWDVHEDTAVALGDRAWVPGRSAACWPRRVRRSSAGRSATCTCSSPRTATARASATSSRRAEPSVGAQRPGLGPDRPARPATARRLRRSALAGRGCAP